jgi:hypothetical protein
MTPVNNLEKYVDKMIGIFNALRYDEDGEVVKEASTTVSVDKGFFDNFNNIKQEIAIRIDDGKDICQIYHEFDGYVCYQILDYYDNFEYIEIKLRENYNAFVAFHSSSE